MDKFNKLKQHIEEKAKEFSDLADSARVSMNAEKKKVTRDMLLNSWKRYTAKATALFEVINFMNNMED